MPPTEYNTLYEDVFHNLNTIYNIDNVNDISGLSGLSGFLLSLFKRHLQIIWTNIGMNINTLYYMKKRVDKHEVGGIRLFVRKHFFENNIFESQIYTRMG